MARRGGSLERERFWRDAIRRQRASDLTIRAFCHGEGMSEASFHWWRRELVHRGVRPATRRHGTTTSRLLRGATQTSGTEAPSAAARFVPVTVAPSAAAYEVHLPSGVRVLVHASAGERLADVLSALEPPAC